MTSTPTHAPTTAAPALSINLAGLTAAQGFSITGNSASSILYTGYSVSNAGDINGDGKDDFLISASIYYSSSAGNVYLIYGGNSLANINLPYLGNSGITIYGFPSSYSISSAGDVNGDGKADFLIGSPSYSSNKGIVYLIYGGSSLVSINLASLGSSGIKITGANANDYSGSSISGADVNGDGKSDILIGAPNANSYNGIVYIIYGGSNLTNINLASLHTSGIKINGVIESGFFGSSVSKAGDINGDGKADILISAPQSTGIVYLLYGGSNLTNINLASLGSSGITITGTESGTGSSVSGAGDINGDGIIDILIGAYGTNSNTGRTYVLYGNSRLTNMDLSLPLHSTQGFIISNERDGSGSSAYGSPGRVSYVGDVNGDGRADILIGAPYASGSGKAYVIFNALAEPITVANMNLATISSSQGLVISGANANDNAGYSVSGAGDVNGDGKADILVGAYGYSFNTGIVYLLYGGVSLTNINLANLGSSGISITGAGTTYFTGYSVAGAGDVNGDGKADILVGAYGYSSNTGIVYLLYGGVSLTNINLANLGSSGITLLYNGTCSNCKIGFSVSGAGDVNGDGFADILIGAPSYSSNTGIVYIIYGGTSLENINLANLGSSGISITGAGTAYFTGYSVSSAGDVNGDGFADILIGAPSYSSTQAGIVYLGIVYLIYGKSSLNNINLASLGSSGLTITGVGSSGSSGYSVSGAGDVNGDGFADILIGNPYYSSTQTGIVYLIYGKSSLNNINLASLGSSGLTITGVGSSDLAGYSVSSAGDVNGDGKADILIGTLAGKTYLIYGNSRLHNIDLSLSLTSTQGFIINEVSSNDGAGTAISYVGDVNGDGRADILIGAPYASGSGKAYVIFNALAEPITVANMNLATISSSQGLVISGANANDNAGYSVSAAGDVNGDGIDDILIGACGYASSTGVYLIYGGSNLTNVNLANLGSSGITITGAATIYSTCYSVSGAGDVNGDGIDDVIMGAPSAYSSSYGYKGASYIIFGSKNIYNINLANLGNSGISITGANYGDQSGWSVSGAGDVNGDGKADILISAPYYSSGTGVVYLIYGKSSLNNINLASLGSSGLTITGIGSGGGAGYSVSGAGDINGDGFADILIGAPSYSSNTGIVYIIYGGTSLANINLANLGSSGITITGSGGGAGYSVSGAGDVNGDGFADILIGAPSYSSNTGIVYIIYGGTSLANINLANLGSSGITITGSGRNFNTGCSVSSAGDVNGDGKADILIGASYAYYKAGKAYLIYGSSVLTNIDLSLPFVSTKGFTINGVSGGISRGDSAGSAVSCAGDINGDGKADILIGAPYSSGSGKAYVIFNAFANSTSVINMNLNTISSSQGLVISGANANDNAGYSVSGAGDVNGDGKADILVGAYGYSSNTGIAYTIYGAASGLITCNPTSYPSGRPSKQPINRPSGQPSRQPTGQPSSQPTMQPMGHPSSQPSKQPTSRPTTQPIDHPSGQPSSQPSGHPTEQPINHPSSQPSDQPTSKPTEQPTDHPSGQPTNHPSRQPTNQPSDKPSEQPTDHPSAQPTEKTSSQPTNRPSVQPSGHPSGQPTERPSHPSSQPSKQPTDRPSEQPTYHPSGQPTERPSTQPLSHPTEKPSGQSTELPTAQPTEQPSSQPSDKPSDHPTGQPTEKPSEQPSGYPTGQPTERPTSQPSYHPSRQPSDHPSNQPTLRPTEQPTEQPTGRPTSQPSDRPSVQPSDHPSGQPTERPTNQPGNHPSAQPNGHPSDQPSGQPSMQPTSHPSEQPSKQPSKLSNQSIVINGGAETGDMTGWVDSGNTFQTGWLATSSYGAHSGVYSFFTVNNGQGATMSQSLSLIVGAPYSVSLYASCALGAGTCTLIVTIDGFTPISTSNIPSVQSTYAHFTGTFAAAHAIATLQVQCITGNNLLLDDISISTTATALPTLISTAAPTNPTGQPSGRPSGQPSEQPSAQPTDRPSGQPFDRPSIQPTSQPTSQPIDHPSMQPSDRPSTQPTDHPSSQPTERPSDQPTDRPSAKPTDHSRRPSTQPTEKPSAQPTDRPSGQPSDRPSMQPTSQPTSQLINHPSMQPSDRPSTLPSDHPTGQPTDHPSGQPTERPSDQPTSRPTEQPSAQPSMQPSDQTTERPSEQPIERPSTQPTSKPTNQPIEEPSARPSDQPTISQTDELSNGEYITTNITDGGTYERRAQKTHFILDSNKDIKITGEGSHALFIIMAHNKANYVITNFNHSSDLINLQDFKHIHNMQDINFTAGSIILNLDNQQRVILSNLNIVDITPSNFILSILEDQPTGHPTSQPSSQPSAQPSTQPSAASGHKKSTSAETTQNTIIGSVTGAGSIVSGALLWFFKSVISDFGKEYIYKPFIKMFFRKNNKVLPSSDNVSAETQNQIQSSIIDGRDLEAAQKNNEVNERISFSPREARNSLFQLKNNKVLPDLNDFDIAKQSQIRPSMQAADQSFKNAANQQLTFIKEQYTSSNIEKNIPSKHQQQKTTTTQEPISATEPTNAQASTATSVAPMALREPTNAQGPATTSVAPMALREPTNAQAPTATNVAPMTLKGPTNAQGPISTSVAPMALREPTNTQAPITTSVAPMALREPTNAQGPITTSVAPMALKEPTNTQGPINTVFSIASRGPTNAKEPTMQPSNAPSPKPSRAPSSESYYTECSQPKLEIVSNKLGYHKEMILSVSAVKFNIPAEKLKDMTIHIDPKLANLKSESNSVDNEQLLNLNQLTHLESDFADNDQAFNLNHLISSSINFRQLIECLPIIKCTSKNIIYPVIENYLPEFFQNITYPEILDNKVFLFTTHLVIGNAGAALLPEGDVVNGMIVATLGSVNLGTRFVSTHYLNKQQQELETPEALSITKYCSVTLVGVMAPSLITCAMTKFILPRAECSLIDFGIKIGVVVFDCISFIMEQTIETTQVSSETLSSEINENITDIMGDNLTCHWH